MQYVLSKDKPVWKCFLVGRSSPVDSIILQSEKVEEWMEVETTSLSYIETEVCIDMKKLEEIAREIGKPANELDDDDIAEWLLDKYDIEGKVKGDLHYFFRDW